MIKTPHRGPVVVVSYRRAPKRRQMTITRDITMYYQNNRLIRLISSYIHADHRLLQAYCSKQQWNVYVGNLLNEKENYIKKIT